jgi:hypothetical protein
MSNGGSHTAFNGATFGAAGFGLSVGVAGAMLAGARNLIAAREADFVRWSISQLRNAIVLSEVRRGHELQAHAQTISERDGLLDENLELKREIIALRKR